MEMLRLVLQRRESHTDTLKILLDFIPIWYSTDLLVSIGSSVMNTCYVLIGCIASKSTVYGIPIHITLYYLFWVVITPWTFAVVVRFTSISECRIVLYCIIVVASHDLIWTNWISPVSFSIFRIPISTCLNLPDSIV